MQAPIVPVSVFPDQANTLVVDSVYLPLPSPPSYRWSLSKSVKVDGGFVYTSLRDGNGQLTQDQWNKWTTQPDSILLEYAAENLGVELD